MRVHVTTTLACQPDRVWAAVLTTALLRYVCAPLVRFRALDPQELPTEWADGDYLVGMRLFGFIPFGRQHIVISRARPTAESFTLRDNGYGDVIRKWVHCINIRSDPAGTHYSDTIDIDAGLMTPLIWLWAEGFYRWRQLVRYQILCRGSPRI